MQLFQRFVTRLVMSLLVALMAGSTAFSAPQNDPTPNLEDTPSFLQPKEARFTVEVTPEVAKPGDTVTYSITAEVDHPWHIYAHAEVIPDDLAAVPTQFDFFRTGGLELGESGWTPSRSPTIPPQTSEILFFDYYEGEVSWSRTLEVPPGISPGKIDLQAQVQFQLCSDTSCLPPAYRTIPVATLTINEGAAGADPSSSEVLGAMDDPEPTPPKNKPSVSDSPRVPNQVQFSTSIEPKVAAPGESVTYSVTAKVEEPWHIYAYSPELLSGVTAFPTMFELFDTDGLDVAGEWTPDRPALEPEPGNNVLTFDFYEDEITWSVPLKVPNDANAGTKSIYNQVSFMICDDKSCQPLAMKTLDPVVLTVAGAPVGTAVAGSSTSAATGGPGINSDVQQAIDSGIFSFIALSAGAGLLALVMPCVWPMIPITVNFFVKQGEAKKGNTTGLAVTYSLAIIITFTALGLLAAVIFDASGAQTLAVNPWLNLFVAGLFVFFGLMLLGVIEFGLPSGLVNSLSRMSGKGGLLGVIFMALTLTVTSFTCTFPVVGSLLVLASQGSLFYPIVGMVTFATVLATPFFLLAMTPKLLKSLPKGGDWMNAVKVVGGLVEIAAAFKFLNNAEIGFGSPPSDAWTNAPATLSIWIGIMVVCGLYLLGLFQTDHDHETPKVGAGRMLSGSLFLCLALFLTPALFGHPPRSQVWDRLIVGLLPPDIDSLAGEALPEEPAPMPASDSPEDIVKAARSRHGVYWGYSFENALANAEAQNKPILIDFTGVFCTNCRQMEQGVFPKPEIISLLSQFETVSLYTDRLSLPGLSSKDQSRLARANQEFQQQLTGDVTLPLYVAVRPLGDGEIEVIDTIGGFNEVPVFQRFLQDALNQFNADSESIASIAAE